MESPEVLQAIEEAKQGARALQAMLNVPELGCNCFAAAMIRKAIAVQREHIATLADHVHQLTVGSAKNPRKIDVGG